MNTEQPRDIGSLTETDFQRYRVWEFQPADNQDGIGVVPVHDCPVSSAIERIIATQVKLANGQILWATIQGFVRGDRSETQRNLSLSLLWGDRRIFLGDTNMYSIAEYSPTGVAAKLGLTLQEVFPIYFDVRESLSDYGEAAYGRVTGQIEEG